MSQGQKAQVPLQLDIEAPRALPVQPLTSPPTPGLSSAQWTVPSRWADPSSTQAGARWGFPMDHRASHQGFIWCVSICLDHVEGASLPAPTRTSHAPLAALVV